MSRVLPALLSGKRKAALQAAAAEKGDGVSPEKEKNSDRNARSRDSRTLAYAELTHGPGPAAGSVPLSSTNSISRAGAAATRHTTTYGEQRSPRAVAADGTPIAFDSTTEANHSRNFGHDDRRNSLTSAGDVSKSIASTPLKNSSPSDNFKQISMSPSPSTSALAPPDGTLSSGLLKSMSMAGSQPVGEGSLSLDTLIRRASISEVLAPRPRHNILDSGNPDIKLYVTGQNSTLEAHEIAVRLAQDVEESQRSYPPVFEHSDLGTSSSSSSLSSPAISTGRQNAAGYFSQPVIQIEKAVSRENITSQSPNRQSSESTSLAPTSSILRGRSGSGASSTSQKSVRLATSPSSRTRKISGKKGKGSAGIAGALALSGIALAAPGPNLSQPIQITGVNMPNGKPKQLQRNNSSDHASPPNSTSTSSNFFVPGPSQPPMVSRSSEEASGYDSERPLSHYSPEESPQYEDELYGNMVSIDALGDFDDVMNQLGAGYALASSKRNTDFHGIFKNIPEDDYLIEGKLWLRIRITCLIKYYRRLWMCSTARNPDTGPPLHLRASPLLQC